MADYDPESNYQYDANDDTEESDYDPTSTAPAPTSAPTLKSPTGAEQSDDGALDMGGIKKPRTVGGFVVDDEDDEGSPPPTSAIANHQSALSSAQNPSSYRSHTQTPLQAQNPSGPFAPVPSNPSASVSANPINGAAAVSSLPAGRLAQDRVGMLEDRITDDPRGDMEAWKELIGEYQRRSKYDEARAVYDRFFKVFPQAVDQWVAYAKMELELEEFYRLEQIFTRTLMNLPSVQLWSVYLDYVRRRQNLTNDPSGKARQTITQAFDLCLMNVGLDKDSGFIWQDYVNFVKQGPGVAGGNTWQDQQKMDSVRKAYQKAIIVPMQSVNQLWQEYSKFENELNKVTGRKFLQERMPAFMTAKQSFVALNTLTKNLIRTSLPTMPPMEGSGGYADYIAQVGLWRKWIEWEKEDPLVLKDEDIKAYQNRIVYVYRHALMALRFWPEMWAEASDYCFANDMEKQGTDFLTQGMEANPESCLLAFKRADRLEVSTVGQQGTDPVARGAAVRAPYNSLLEALLSLRKKIEERGKKSIAHAEAAFSQISANGANGNGEDDDDDGDSEEVKMQKAAHQNAITALQQNLADQVLQIRKTTTWVWITLIRAMRRILGKGKGGDSGGGFRQVFAEARKKNLTADLYIQCSAIEWQCYHDPAGTKILEKAFTQLFKDDENVALAYIKHLIDINDMTNAHAAFETAVNRFSQDPAIIYKAKPLYQFFHSYEAKFGELAQVMKLEKRMTDLWPEDSIETLFVTRFTSENAHGRLFDPTQVRFVISPATQLKPVAMPTMPMPVGGAGTPQLIPATLPILPMNTASPQISIVQPASTNSPKRAFDHDSDHELQPPRKLARGESPALKGAAGRRMEAKRPTTQAPPLPRDIHFLLSILPPASAAQRVPKVKIADLIRTVQNVDLTRAQQPANGMPQQVQTPQIGSEYGLPPPQSVPPPNVQYAPPPQGYGQQYGAPSSVPPQMPFAYPPPPQGYGQAQYGQYR